MAKTFYDIFEVDASATPDEIRAAYKRMMQRHHPDKHPGQASSEELVKAINYAYNILSDAHKRANYDSKLANSTNGATAANGGGGAYVYTGGATVNSPSGAQSASSTRASAADTVAGQSFETRDLGWSQISQINSWLALGMLALMFLAVSQFFYQVITSGALSTAEPGSTTLFYGMLIGVIIAAGAVWLVGKMVAYTLPLTWPMHLIFRGKVRTDLTPEHRRIASAILVMGILLTFAVPDLNPNLNRQGTVAVPSTAATGAAFEDTAETPVAAQSPRKNTTMLPERGPASPIILAQNTRSALPAKPRELQDLPPPMIPLIVKKPNAPVAKAPPASPHNPTTASLPSSRLMSKQKVSNIPITEAGLKPVEPPAAPVIASPSEPTSPSAIVVDQSVITPPTLALVSPESGGPLIRSVPEKKEALALRSHTALAEEGDSTLAYHHQRAQQGATDAQYQLGRAYEKGDGVARDYRQAEAWYRKAADHGYGPAQYSLGSMYMLGKGVTIDPVAAYVWLSLAVNNNISSGQQAVDYLDDILTPEQIAAAKRKVAKWSPQRKR